MEIVSVKVTACVADTPIIAVMLLMVGLLITVDKQSEVIVIKNGSLVTTFDMPERIKVPVIVTV